ncbi:12384_t:CDS:2 [Dentiscutata erythropus]|uniref:12384_t:CDS:1 n=1 Tax=Dentiscutata erythropus TaxID=1348616 RepID=A0A9N9I377_9GLOM|nr:12384_t:CDS:2 [Dentiscutata erythropus]
MLFGILFFILVNAVNIDLKRRGNGKIGDFCDFDTDCANNICRTAFFIKPNTCQPTDKRPTDFACFEDAACASLQCKF